MEGIQDVGGTASKLSKLRYQRQGLRIISEVFYFNHYNLRIKFRPNQPI